MLRCRVNTDQLHRLAVVVVVGNHVAGLCVGHREERREVGGVDDPACVQIAILKWKRCINGHC